MADFAYTPFKAKLLQALVDFDAPADFEVALVMTNTTADTDQDATHMGTDEITTLDEYDGASYVRKSLASDAVATDLANDRGEYDAANITFSTLGVGTRQAQAMVVLVAGAAATDEVPLVFIDSGGFPFDGNGGDVTVTWNAEGILQVT